MISGSRSARHNLIFILTFFFAIYLTCVITKNEARHMNQLPQQLDPNRVGQRAPESPEEHHRLCSTHGFKPHTPNAAGRPRRVYDLFLFNSEMDWLEIRLNQMAADVDYFVIVESPTTFTGLEKPLYLEKNWNNPNFTKFHDKIIRKTVTDPGASLGLSTWKHEEFMRDALFNSVFPEIDKTERGAQEGDVLMVSDLDEIPRPETIMALRHCDFPDRLTLRSAFYYYSFFTLVIGDQWPHPQATTYHGLTGTISPSSLRNKIGGFFQWLPWRLAADMPNAAWHCSSCFGTIAEVRTKMESFSHTPLNTEYNRQPGNIVARFRDGFDLYGRKGIRYEKMFINPDTPRYTSDNNERFKYLYSRDGLDAGFTDAKDWNMTIVPDKGQRWVGQGEWD